MPGPETSVNVLNVEGLVASVGPWASKGWTHACLVGALPSGQSQVCLEIPQ